MEVIGLDLISQQLRQLKLNPVPRVSFERNKTEPNKVIYIITGPWESAHEDYLMEVTFTYSSSYPTEKPKIKFPYDPLHPNILFKSDIEDSICCNLFTSWNSYTTTQKTVKEQMLALLLMFKEPNFPTGYGNFNSDQKNLFKNNKQEYRNYLIQNLKDMLAPLTSETEEECDYVISYNKKKYIMTFNPSLKLRNFYSEIKVKIPDLSLEHLIIAGRKVIKFEDSKMEKTIDSLGINSSEYINLILPHDLGSLKNKFLY